MSVTLAQRKQGKLSPKFQVIRDDYRSLPLKNKTYTHIRKVTMKTLYFKFVLLLKNCFLLSRGNEKLLKSQRFTHR